MSALRLDLGTLDLVSADGGEDAYWFEVLADGFSAGSPEAVKTVVASFLRDGENSRINSFGNRTVSFRVQVCAPDSNGLNQGEKALALELESPTTVSLEHPDGYSTTVWDVFNATMSAEVDDVAWLRSPMTQVYAVELECFPWSRPTEKSSVTFTPGAGTPATVDNASSATNWHPTGAIATTTWGSDANVLEVTSGVVSAHTYGGVATTPVDWLGTVPATVYLAIDLAAKTTLDDVAKATGITGLKMGGAFPVAVADSPITGFVRYYFLNTGAAPVFDVTTTTYNSTSAYFLIGGLYSMATIPATGVFVADIGGSVRTTGSLTIGRASGITHLFAYSDPVMLATGYNPDLPGTWSRAIEGDYAYWAKVTSLGGASTGDVFAMTVTSDATGAVQTLTTRYTGASGSVWIPLGMASLGGLRDKTIGDVTLAVTKNNVPVASPVLRMYRHKDGETALNYFREPPTGTATEVIIDIPSLEYEHGGVWANGIDALDVCPVWEYFDIKPPQVALSILMASTSGMTVTFDYYKHFHTYVGEEA